MTMTTTTIPGFDKGICNNNENKLMDDWFFPLLCAVWPGGDDVDEEEQVREEEDDDDGDVNSVLNDNATWRMVVMTMIYVWLHPLFRRRSLDSFYMNTNLNAIQRYIRELLE